MGLNVSTVGPIVARSRKTMRIVVTPIGVDSLVEWIDGKVRAQLRDRLEHVFFLFNIAALTLSKATFKLAKHSTPNETLHEVS